MEQPEEEPFAPYIQRPPRPSWIRQHAVLAVVLAGVTGLGAGIGLAAATGITGTAAAVSGHLAAATGSPSPSSVYSLMSQAAACSSAGGNWDGTTCSTPAPSPDAPGPSAPGMLEAGQAEQLQDTSSGATIGMLTVKSVQVSTQSADGSGMTPVNGYFVVVHVSAAADPSYSSGWYISESQFYDLAKGQHFDNGDGNAFNALTSGEGNSLATTLAAGETTGGWLSFDVPSRHGEIVFAPNTNGQPIAEWSY